MKQTEMVDVWLKSERKINNIGNFQQQKLKFGVELMSSENH